MSYEELAQLLQDALIAKFGRDAQNFPQYYLQETFDSYLIARGPDGDLYQIDYTVDPNEDENIALGEPVEVETAYVPVQESARFLVTEASANPDEDGWSWPVQVMKAGFASGTVSAGNGRIPLPQYFTPEVVAQVAAAVDGARFGRRHPVSDMEEQDPARIAGYLSDARLDGDTAVAKVNLLKSEPEIRGKLMAAREAGKLDLFGVSVFGYFGFKRDKVNGQDALVSTKLAKVVSVDFCGEPAAGGRFLATMRTAAASSALAEISKLQRSAVRAPANQTDGSPRSGAGQKDGGAIVKDRILKVLEALRLQDAGRATELTTEFNTLKDEGYNEFLLKVTEAAADAVKKATESKNENFIATVQAAQAVLQETKLMQSANAVQNALAESKLPQPAQELVKTHLANRVVTAEEVKAEIERVRSAFAAMSPVGRVGAGVMVGLETVDKVKLAVDKTLGVKGIDASIKPFRGLQEMYQFITGDREMRMGQGLYRVSEAIATSDFPNILLDSMTKRLIQDYAEVGMNGLDQIFTTTTVQDFKTQNRIREGYLADLPTVAEAGTYQEFTKPTDEKATYAVGKFGGLLTISEETIRNDDLGKIAQFPGRMARSARRTLKQFVTNFFINNPAIYDTITLFHASHNNLGSNTLDSGGLMTSHKAMFQQTEKDSGKPLALRTKWIMVHPQNMELPLLLNTNMTSTNYWYQYFGQNNEGIIINELLSTVNRWFIGADKADCPCVEIGFLQGYDTPQIFLNNNPIVGTEFSNDQIQYKVKFIFGGAPIDFRGVYRNN